MTPTAHPRPRQCPNAQQLAAYIDGRLSLAERNALTVHIADCPPCVTWLAGTVKTLTAIFSERDPKQLS